MRKKLQAARLYDLFQTATVMLSEAKNLAFCYEGCEAGLVFSDKGQTLHCVQGDEFGVGWG
ncbi:MAG: hypothetical protein VB108_04520 [Anaerolineaceae bacterium]|nr:hypothetical protein [Anaerolineaceae bacterium]